ncbi:hypothetical protein MCUN1_001946 [Malassezia cuniculi]|uniref:CAP-Gly domain-containing protein n=1 Tax=Malassezia cuniculi TaxID=948313 RepID=A0AAF0J632_9BASI|nr:hypothetical protein MCUN1_001946 [Malassezia cuniculi]
MSVTLAVYAPSARVCTEKVFSVTSTLSELQSKIERITGIPYDAQTLQLYSSWDGERPAGALVGSSAGLDGDSQVLSLWRAASGMAVMVADSNPSRSAWLDEEVDKFELSDAEYAKRGDSVRAFMQANSLGRFAPEQPEPNAQPAQTENMDTSHITVGSRCVVGGPDSVRRGTVRFVGETGFARGVWVGVEYDEPVGKNDGSVAGKRYFTARANYGSFVKPSLVEVGDFPELEDIDEL